MRQSFIFPAFRSLDHKGYNIERSASAGPFIQPPMSDLATAAAVTMPTTRAKLRAYGRARGIQEGQVITGATAEAWLIEDAREHNMVIHAALPWLKRLDPVRRRVVENMHFNMGRDNPKTPAVEGLAQFKNTLGHIEAGRYAEAAAAMRVSLWARQVKGRAVRLAREMETGRITQ